VILRGSSEIRHSPARVNQNPFGASPGEQKKKKKRSKKRRNRASERDIRVPRQLMEYSVSVGSLANSSNSRTFSGWRPPPSATPIPCRGPRRSADADVAPLSSLANYPKVRWRISLFYSAVPQDCSDRFLASQEKIKRGAGPYCLLPTFIMRSLSYASFSRPFAPPPLRPSASPALTALTSFTFITVFAHVLFLPLAWWPISSFGFNRFPYSHGFVMFSGSDAFIRNLLALN
jgi:hypothetical protein